MRTRERVLAVAGLAAILLVAGGANADVFGTAANQFTIDFVPISDASNPTSGSGIVNYDYRMGTYEVTNDQWSKFTANLGIPVTGADRGYSSNRGTYLPGANMPVAFASWYGAAQFANWLNTSTGHPAAYKFTGTQGASDYTFAPWSPSDVGYDAGNPYRNSSAMYCLPTENEWVKAAYWNGTSLQDYATKAGDTLHPGYGSNGRWNYYYINTSLSIGSPWNVGSGSQELNGTYDMMGNVWEWTDSYAGIDQEGWGSTVYGRYFSISGGSAYPFDLGYGQTYGDSSGALRSGYYDAYPAAYTQKSNMATDIIGFRVVQIPEPASVGLLTLGGLALLRRRSH